MKILGHLVGATLAWAMFCFQGSLLYVVLAWHTFTGGLDNLVQLMFLFASVVGPAAAGGSVAVVIALLPAVLLAEAVGILRWVTAVGVMALVYTILGALISLTGLEELPRLLLYGLGALVFSLLPALVWQSTISVTRSASPSAPR